MLGLKIVYLEEETSNAFRKKINHKSLRVLEELVWGTTTLFFHQELRNMEIKGSGGNKDTFDKFPLKKKYVIFLKYCLTIFLSEELHLERLNDILL